MSIAAPLKDGLRAVLYRCGVLGAWHRWRNRRALTVLMFHRVLPADDPAFALAEREFTFTLGGFRRTLDFVQRHYSVVSLGDLQAARQEQRLLPPNPMLITFDDGWRDTLTYAAPELAQRGLPAVLFLASEVVALDSPRWWQDALVAALAGPGAFTRLCAAAGWAETPKGSASQALAAHLGAMSESGRWAWLEQHAPDVRDQVEERQMVTLGELKALKAGRFAIGGHGHTHSPLTLSTDPEAELQASQYMLGELNQPVRSMSFPHGAWSSELAAAARKSGFEWIFTSDAVLADLSRWPSPLPALGRIHMPENAWTCRAGDIDPARLATFLFFRPLQFY
ncbi:polysaccharide deacetylase family protein [Alicycliphilus denitrificans]|uniref:Polysaccharide deacetylase n=1 Tax=Alicycliphilus denitrificans TaxID=179636 RepID=A0A3R7LGD8_9BURK|nr:polysaccharide deacetylase family protein [Alicycliphilus denitrificans]RKJ98415.1 polysaccharide deacetylase [Alicycliphilus denitrificans]